MLDMQATRPFGAIAAQAALAVLIGVVLSQDSADAVTVYRIGAPYTAAERDSLDGLGIEYRQVDWSASQEQNALDADGLAAGHIQPNYLDADEDIAATLLSRGGRVWIFLFSHHDHLVGQVLLDQDPATGYSWPAIAPESFTSKTYAEKLTMDLGGRFLIREVRFRTLPERPDLFLESLALGISNVGFDVYRIPWFSVVATVKENTEPEVRIVLDPPITTEALQLRINRPTIKEIGLAAFEVYGGGYVKQASFESDVFELPDIASWGEIRWSGRQDPKARVEIRTRSGIDPQPEVYWESRTEQQDSVQFLQGGGDLSFTEYKRQYARLSDILKPVDPLDWVSPDAENWSFWSSPYSFEEPGVDIVSPGPRRYFQISADFASDVEDGGQLDYIEFTASVPPAVRRLVGEITPAETTIGEATQFTYYIRPTIRSGDSSFDGVEIMTPSGVVSVDSLRVAGIGQDVFASSIHADGRGFEVVLPRRLEPTDSGALVEVVFTAPVLREVGTVFAGRVFDTARPQEVRQRILPGNADDEVEADALSVRTALSRSLLLTPEIRPNPFTPNGDGVNDEVRISYKLLRLTAAVPVSIEVFDLSGRLVKRVFDGGESLGEYVHTWDGTDASMRLVSPGLYLCRIVADVQSEAETSTSLLSVVY